MRFRTRAFAPAPSFRPPGRLRSRRSEQAREEPADARGMMETDGPGLAPKRDATLRVDEDVLRWFRGQGRGRRTRMNDVLRAFVLMRVGWRSFYALVRLQDRWQF
ncbi:MAG: BrnA antitoxin family protein [Pseudomonadota bacterium]